MSNEYYMEIHASTVNDLLNMVNSTIISLSTKGTICRLVNVYYNSDRHLHIAIMSRREKE